MTVVVCTGAADPTIYRCLQSLAEQDFAGECEVIVVDNSASPGSRHFSLCVADALGGLPHRIVLEPTPGLSSARNRGFSEAAGDVVAYIDDDAQAAPGWLGALSAGFTEDRAWMAGGPIFADYETRRPPWLHPEMDCQLSLLDYGPRRRYLHYPDYLFGTNMAIRRVRLAQIGGFSLSLGRMGRNLLSGEETDLQKRVSRVGGGILYIPEASVVHRVPRSRLRLGFFTSRSYWQGVTATRSGVMCRQDATGIFVQCLRIGAWLCRSAAALVSGRRSEAALDLTKCAFVVGCTWEAARQTLRGHGACKRHVRQATRP